jgi:hypothetical protein
MADEQELPQNAQGEVDIPLHGTVSPAPGQVTPLPIAPTAAPVAPVAGTQISPSPVAQPAMSTAVQATPAMPAAPTMPVAPVAPVTPQPQYAAQPVAPQVIQPTVQATAPQVVSPASASPPPPPAAPPAEITLQWCPSCQVGISQPEAGNVCPACGTPLVPIPPEYSSEEQ